MQPRRHRADRHAERRRAASGWHCFVRRGGFEARQGRRVRELGSLAGRLLLRLATPLLCSRRAPAPRPRLPARGPRPRRGGATLVRGHGDSTRSVRSSIPGGCQSDDSHQQARIWLRVRALLLLSTRTVRSWAWSGRCYPRSILPGWRNWQRGGLLIRRLRVRVPPPELVLDPVSLVTMSRDGTLSRRFR